MRFRVGALPRPPPGAYSAPLDPQLQENPNASSLYERSAFAHEKTEEIN